VDRWAIARRLDPAARPPETAENRAVYTKTGKPGVFVTKVLEPGQLTQVLGSAEIKAKWRVTTLLNTMPEAEALALYR